MFQETPFKQWVWSSNLQRVTRKREIPFGISLFLFPAEIRKTQMQQSGGLLLPPVQTLVATTIFARGKNANESPAGERPERRRGRKQRGKASGSGRQMRTALCRRRRCRAPQQGQPLRLPFGQPLEFRYACPRQALLFTFASLPLKRGGFFTASSPPGCQNRTIPPWTR